jgi:hypothetical protein
MKKYLKSNTAKNFLTGVAIVTTSLMPFFQGCAKPIEYTSIGSNKIYINDSNNYQIQLRKGIVDEMISKKKTKTLNGEIKTIIGAGNVIGDLDMNNFFDKTQDVLGNKKIFKNGERLEFFYQFPILKNPSSLSRTEILGPSGKKLLEHKFEGDISNITRFIASTNHKNPFTTKFYNEEGPGTYKTILYLDNQEINSLDFQITE